MKLIFLSVDFCRWRFCQCLDGFLSLWPWNVYFACISIFSWQKIIFATCRDRQIWQLLFKNSPSPRSKNDVIAQIWTLQLGTKITVDSQISQLLFLLSTLITKRLTSFLPSMDEIDSFPLSKFIFSPLEGKSTQRRASRATRQSA